MKINKRKLKYGSLSTAITIVFIAIVVIVNLIISSLSDKYSLKLDLTDNKIFEISQDTIDYISKIDKDVDIEVMADEYLFEVSGTHYKQVAEVIKKYAQYSDHINVEFVDMDKNPNKVSKYKEMYTGTISKGSIVINSGNKIKVLNSSDLFNVDNGYVASSKAEYAITSGVMYVTDANPVKVAMISGDISETAQYAIQNLLSQLSSNGYEIAECDVLMDTLDDDIDTLIIPAPLNDYTPAMIEKVSDFLQNDGKLGKSAIYIGDFNQNATPNLCEFLKEWGIEIDNSGVVMEQDDKMKQPVLIYAMGSYYNASLAQIVDEDFQDAVTDSKLPIVVPFARPLTLAFESSNNREAKIILSTPATSAIYPDDVPEDFDISKQPQSVRNVMALGTKYTFENNQRLESKLLVISSAEMLDVMIMKDKSYNNSEFVLNSINKLTGKTDVGITVLDKSMDTISLSLTESSIKVIGLVVIAFIPLAVVNVGIVVFLRRKKL